MGRKSRNTAKTGDVAIYKSRGEDEDEPKKVMDTDNMYNEIDRYHNATNDLQEDMLKFNREDDEDEDENDVENVFDLGLDDDESDDDDSEDSDDSDGGADQRGNLQHGSSETDDGSDIEGEDDDDDDSSIDMEMPETDVLNWGKRKKDYYHGDTADLEIGQQVEDAELEEEAGKDVLKTRMEGMTEKDFMLDGDDDSDDDQEQDKEGEEKLSKSLALSMTETMQKNITKLSTRDKLKFMGKNHPECLPLLTHFREECIRPCMEETLVVTNAMFQSKENAEAVGATKEGLIYLLNKAMIETSTALNVCQYLLIKADHTNSSSKNESNDDDDENIIDSQDEDFIKNHPVIQRLNQLNHMKERLETSVESKVPGLRDQIDNLAKASSLMVYGEENDDASSSASEEPSDNEIDTNQNKTSSLVTMNEDIIRSSADNDDDDDDMVSTASSSDDEDILQRQKDMMNEARFALRSQDDISKYNEENERGSKRQRRAMVIGSSDYGDEDIGNEDDLNKAAKSLASTINTISQKHKKHKMVTSVEGADDENQDRFMRGLEMMEGNLGNDDDDDIENQSNEDGGELNNDFVDDAKDDFYAQMKKKSKDKKEFKKQMYSVAPKYPGMDDEIAGERSVGQMILKNRGLVAHKAKINRNPRVKKREQYRKAIIRRKGAVRDVRTEEVHKYGGEQTGIKSGLSRSRKL